MKGRKDTKLAGVKGKKKTWKGQKEDLEKIAVWVAPLKKR